jgi:hypothetical protein
MKYKTKWWATNVPVKIVGEFDAFIAGQYFRGSSWPFSIFSPGRMELLDKYKDQKDVIAHEIQHANDLCHPFRMFVMPRASAAQHYWLEMRGCAQGLKHLPEHAVEANIKWFAKYVLSQAPGKAPIEQVEKELRATMKKLKKVKIS